MKIEEDTYRGLGRGPHTARIGSVTEREDGTVELAWHIKVGEEPFSFAQGFNADQIAELATECGLAAEADPRELIDKKLKVKTATYGGYTEARVTETGPLPTED